MSRREFDTSLTIEEAHNAVIGGLRILASSPYHFLQPELSNQVARLLTTELTKRHDIGVRPAREIAQEALVILVRVFSCNQKSMLHLLTRIIVCAEEVLHDRNSVPTSGDTTEGIQKKKRNTVAAERARRNGGIPLGRF